MNSKKKKKSKAVPRKGNGLLYAVAAVGLLASTLCFSSDLADISNTPRHIALSLTLLCGSLYLVFHKRVGERRVRWTPFSVCCSLFVVWQCLSVVWAVNKGEALYDASRWLLAGTTVMLVRRLFAWRPAHGVVLLSTVAAVVFVVSAIVAASQMSSLGDLSWNSRYSIASLYTHKGTFAMLMLLLSLFFIMRLGLLFRLRSRLRHYKVLMVFYSLLTAGCWFLILFLQARSALVAAFAMLLFAVLLWIISFIGKRKKKQPVLQSAKPFGLRRLITTVILAMLVGVVVVGGCRWFASMSLPGPDQSGGIRSNASVYERQSLWRMTFRMVDENPVYGCGAGNWKVCYPSAGVGDVFSIDVLDFVFVRPHNDWLRVLSETGYVGLALLLLAAAALLVGLFAVAWRRRLFLVASAAGVAGVMAFALFDFPFDRVELLLWSSILVGVASGLSSPTTSVASPLVSILRWLLPVLLLLTLLLGIGRYSSEVRQAEIVLGIHSRRWAEVERSAREARKAYCTINSSGMPYAYYEAMALEYQKRPALATFRVALGDNPWNKQLLNDVARLEFVENHNVDTAVVLLREAIRISPSFAHSYFNLAQVFIEEGRYGEALEVMESMDLDAKQLRSEEMVWHYHEGKTAEYYTHDVIDAERKRRDGVVAFLQGKLSPRSSTLSSRSSTHSSRSSTLSASM